MSNIYISSNNSKMGDIPSFSLSPTLTCNHNQPCFNKCYAKKLETRLEKVKNTWTENTKLVNENIDQVFSKIDGFLKFKTPKYFRWHVGGEVINKYHFKKIIEIAKNNPKIIFLLFTKKHKLAFKLLDKIPANLKVRLSVWGSENAKKYQTNLKNTLPLAVTILKEETIPDCVKVCTGNCTECEFCFSNNDNNVYFKIH